MAIYLWYNQGRLGNLLLQYQAIMGIIKQSDTVICLDSNLFQLIDKDHRFKVISASIFHKRVARRYIKILNYATKIGLIGMIQPKRNKIEECYSSETKDLIIKHGFLTKVNQIKGYFAHDKWLNHNIRFKSNLQKRIKKKI